MTKQHDDYEYNSNHHYTTEGVGSCSRCGREYALVDGLLVDHKVKRTPWATRGRQCRGVHQPPVK